MATCELPEHLQIHAAQNLSIDLDASVDNATCAKRRKLWAVILGLQPKKDGNRWCVLWGENLMEGVCSFGDSPQEAMENFDKAMNSPDGGYY
jgi:hypothetical protein